MVDTASKIGWVGTGVMGRSMAGRLMQAGYAVHVTTRTRDRARDLLAAGAQWVDNASELTSICPTIMTMVGFPRDVDEVYLGSEGILTSLHGESPLRLVIDLTTSSPALARRIAEEAAYRDLAVLDAPVSGGDFGARDGTLSIMVGGTPEALELARPLLEVLGDRITHLGGAGSGQHTKMVNQILIATNMIGVCEGLLYASKAGLDPLEVIEALGSGAAGSWSVENLAPRMLKRDFKPGFLVEHFIKDMEIALEEAARMDLALPGLALAHQLYLAVRAQGHGRDGTQALLRALETLNGMS